MYSKTREEGGQSWEKIRGGRERRMRRRRRRFWKGGKEEREGWEGEKRRKADVIENSKRAVKKIKGKIGAKEENGKGD